MPILRTPRYSAGVSDGSPSSSDSSSELFAAPTPTGIFGAMISIETSRSKMELLNAFVDFHYPSEIGPGVYDIHSPRVPTVEEMLGLLRKARQVLAPEQLWVNPDCGLKTRGWPEVRKALENMVAAAHLARLEVEQVPA